jgi:DNA-binding protein HU-beta
MWSKTEKNRKNLWETGLLPLTMLAKSRKVDGGSLFQDPHGYWVSMPSRDEIGRRKEKNQQQHETSKVLEKRRNQEDLSKMATATLTKTALVRQMAEKLELTNKQAAAFLDLLAETAIKETKKNGLFVLPGIGRLVKAERKARIGRNPQTGEQIKIKAKTVVKFRVAKSAKDVIAPPKK